MDFVNKKNDEEYKILKKYMADVYDVYISPTIYDIDDDVDISS